MSGKTKPKQKKYLLLVIPIVLLISFVLILKSTNNSLITKELVSESPTPIRSNLSFTTTEMNSGKEEKFTYNVEEIMKNSEVKIPETNILVSLKNGQANFSDGVLSGQVTMGDVFSLVEISENDFDVYGVITVNTGGSGEFVYVVIYHATSQLFENTDSLSVGDRVIVKNIIPLSKNINSDAYVMGVNYLERRENQPMSDMPSVEKLLKARVKSHMFVEN